MRLSGVKQTKVIPAVLEPAIDELNGGTARRQLQQ
jgi:hypothetical protein